jgi:predicted site-specific integrase-resolvase
MIVNIQKAIELTGVSRSTIQRHIKQGKLSRTDKGIDTTELIRVYGALKNTAEQVTVKQPDKSVSDYEKFLLSQVALLTQQLELANERERRLMALIEYQTGADKSGGLFSRLFK